MKTGKEHWVDKKERISATLKELDSTLNAALYDVGFLKGTIGNSVVPEKINGSFSGHTLDICIRAVVVKTLLFVTRSWDTNGSTIVRLAKELDGLGVKIEQSRREKHPDWSDELLEIGRVEAKIQDLIRDTVVFQERPEFLAAKVHRDEHIAHLLKGRSGFGRKLKKNGLEIDPVTLNQLVELAEETAEFVCRLIQIWDFSIKKPNDWIDHQMKNTELFWKIIPSLSESERNFPKT